MLQHVGVLCYSCFQFDLGGFAGGTSRCCLVCSVFCTAVVNWCSQPIFVLLLASLGAFLQGKIHAAEGSFVYEVGSLLLSKFFTKQVRVSQWLNYVRIFIDCHGEMHQDAGWSGHLEFTSWQQ